jgi:hypothetical protein
MVNLPFEGLLARNLEGFPMLETSVRLSMIAVGLAALTLTAGCTSYNQRTSPGVWSAGHAEALPMPAPINRPAPISPSMSVTAPPMSTPQRGSVTTGCEGTFTRLGSNGAVGQQGRAYNTGAGLVQLDARGNRGAAIPAATAGESLLFRPDCNCAAVRSVADAGGPAPMCNGG